MMYLKDKALKLYMDKEQKYKPYNLYLGSKKIGGWKYKEVSGESVNVSDTYNDSAYVKVNGKTIETGTGDKSPSNPYVLNSVNNFDLVSSGKNLFDKDSINNQIGKYIPPATGVVTTTSTLYLASDYIPILPSTAYYVENCDKAMATYDINKVFAGVVTRTGTDLSFTFTSQSNAVYVRLSVVVANKDVAQLKKGTVATPYEPFRGLQTINLPYILRSLPDGTKDYIEIDDVAKSAKLYRNIGLYTFNGTDGWGVDGNYYVSFAFGGGNVVNYWLCTHSIYKLKSGVNPPQNDLHFTGSGAGYFEFSKWTFATAADLNSYLLAQYNAGTPVKVQYKLATPTITDLPYEAVKQYYPQTNVYTNATVQPTLEGKFRIIGN